MAAAFLCSHAGIENRTIDNSAAYISSWYARLSQDRRLLIQAATSAQKAADYILGPHEANGRGCPQAAPRTKDNGRVAGLPQAEVHLPDGRAIDQDL